MSIEFVSIHRVKVTHHRLKERVIEILELDIEEKLKLMADGRVSTIKLKNYEIFTRNGKIIFKDLVRGHEIFVDPKDIQPASDSRASEDIRRFQELYDRVMTGDKTYGNNDDDTWDDTTI